MSSPGPLWTPLDFGLLVLMLCAAAFSRRALTQHSTVGAFLLIVLAFAFGLIALVRVARKYSQRPPSSRGKP
jgi:hypothetical protein